MEYRIKLYGHTSDDPERFRKDLAALLNVDTEEARALLEEVPVVIARTSSGEKAEHFRKSLELIKALSLVEYDETEAAEGQGERPGEARLDVAPDADAETLERKDHLMSRVWLTLLLALSGLAVVIGSVVFLMQWRHLYRENRPAVTRPQPAVSQETEQIEPPDPAAREAELREEIDRLEAKIKDLNFQAGWQKEEVEKLYSRRPVDYDAVQQMKVKLATTKHDIVEARKRLRKLRGRLPSK